MKGRKWMNKSLCLPSHDKVREVSDGKKYDMKGEVTGNKVRKG